MEDGDLGLSGGVVHIGGGVVHGGGGVLHCGGGGQAPLTSYILQWRSSERT